MLKKNVLPVLLLVLAVSALSAETRRPFKLDDLARLREVRDPQIAPDGQWVAYVVAIIDTKEDKTSTHIWMVGYDGKNDRQITFSQDSEAAPRWSTDGKYLSFTSSRPDKAKGNQVWLMDRSGGEAYQLTETKGRLQSYEWSQDSKRLALVIGDPDPDADATASPSPGAGPGGTKAPKPIVIDRYKYKQDGQGYLLSGRNVTPAHLSLRNKDRYLWGKSLIALVSDDRSVYPVSVTRNSVARLLNPPVVVSSLTNGGGHTVLLSGNDTKPTEVYAMEGKTLRQLTHQNDALMAELEIAQTEEVNFKSKDGTDVHGLLTYPVGYVKGTKVPLLLRIHGGPNGQDQYSFSVERQVFAANGYAVLAVNYRGSSGRGQKFSRSIFADWGHYEVEDLQAGVDHVIQMGVADPDRLGVGGWSYGGILTDYMIATDPRFKGATSGAGTAFTVAFYGTDQYIIQYDYEIGPPWNPKAWETYQKISYPFLHADRIKTPTLFLGGERDFNVPVEGGQQMYQALRSLGIDTQLIIYPNENHGITRPSYIRDRYERYLAWYDKYVKKNPPPAKNVAETGTR
jgi:dipeptidyl aminopeptidase/acylaminoacyl peptidase